MASFQKRGKSWQYTVSRYVDGVYKPIRKSGFRTKREAEREARKVEAMLDSGVNYDFRNEVFHEYFKTWYELTKRNLAEITLSNYRRTYDLIKKHFRHMTLGNITTLDYQKFINKIGETRALETISKTHTHIRTAVRTAINDGYISRDFTKNIELNYANPARSNEEKYLNYEDSIILLNKIKDKIKRNEARLTHYLILLGLTTGLRFGELVGLTRNDFDFDNETLNIDKTWGYYKDAPEGFGETKNKQSIRKISVDEYTLDVFKDYFEETDIEEENKHELVTLDVLENVVDEAIENNVNLIISHHPLIFNPLKNIDLSSPKGKTIQKLIQHNITVYTAHTNLDVAEGGVNDLLARKLDIEVTDSLVSMQDEKLYKVAVYVPLSHIEKVREAFNKGGAGHIGNYSHCTFQTEGEGTFKPLKGSDPYSGKIGEIKFADEKKIESIVPEQKLASVIHEIKKAQIGRAHV